MTRRRAAVILRGSMPERATITVNGARQEVPGGTTIAALLARLGVPPEAVAVERNRAIVRRRDHERTALADGDQVEIVTFVGGG